MGTNKLQRFEEISEFEHVLELTDYQDQHSSKPKGRWRADIFGNDYPIILELACGKGSYTLELAHRFPRKNIVGIDIKGARIWKGATRALDEELDNVRFMRMYVDHLYEYFAPAEVDEIWITFPDPYPNGSDRDNRLTSSKFLNIYQKVLKSSGKVRLKTDSDLLFDFTTKIIDKTGCEILESVDSIYDECSSDQLLTIKTDYEKRHLQQGKTISYIKFKLPANPIRDK